MWVGERGVKGHSKDSGLSKQKDKVSFAETGKTSGGAKVNCMKPTCCVRKSIAVF